MGSACPAVGERSGGRITVLKPLFGKTLFNSLYKLRGTLMAPFNLISLSILYLEACVLKE